MKVWVTIEVEAKTVRESDPAYMVQVLHEYSWDDAELISARQPTDVELERQ